MHTDNLDKFLLELCAMIEKDQHSLVPAYYVVDRLTEILMGMPEGVPFDGDEWTKLTKGKKT